MSSNKSQPLSAPAGFDFYYPPTALLEGESGQVIYVRSLTGPAALAAAASNEVVLYRSRDIRGNPIAVSGILALPHGPAPAGGFPIVSWAHGTVGSADTCAPSRDYDTAPTHPYNAYPHLLLNKFLEERWAVVMTDYEGLGTAGPHPYLLGKSEANGILDIVLAARQLHPDLSTRLAIVGHSQGGQAALFGAHHAIEKLKDTEIELRAVAALAPASSIRLIILGSSAATTKQDGYAFTPLFLTGAIAGDPRIKAEEVLTAKAYAMWPETEMRGRAELSQEAFWGGLEGTEQLRLIHSASKQRFLDELEKMHPKVEIEVPIRISQAVNDQRVKVEFTRTLVEALDGKNPGNTVVYEEYSEVATPEFADLGPHFGLIDTDSKPLVKWLKERLAVTKPARAG
jgi:pimeloyl-ACP methyl ester carboxylesterase